MNSAEGDIDLNVVLKYIRKNLSESFVKIETFDMIQREFIKYII